MKRGPYENIKHFINKVIGITARLSYLLFAAFENIKKQRPHSVQCRGGMEEGGKNSDNDHKNQCSRVTSGISLYYLCFCAGLLNRTVRGV